MDEHGLSEFREVSHSLFGHTILEMGVDATKGKLLSLFVCRFP